MRKIYVFLFAVVFITPAIAQDNPGLEKDKEAIKAVILEETQSFCDRDFNRYAATYKHDNSIVDLRAYKTNYYHVTGWEANSAGIRDFISNNPEPMKNLEAKKNFDIHVIGNAAWAVFENDLYSEEGKLMDTDIGVNFLEKIDGEWKIVYLSRVGITSYGPELEEIDVPAEVLSTYQGKYELQPGFILEIMLEGNQLFIHPTGQPKMPIYAYEEDKFFLKTIDARCVFNSEEDKVVSLTLHQNGEHIAPRME